MKPKQKESNPDNLVGRFFHSINDKDRVEWQGVVVGSPQPGWYLVQLFEWMMGEPNVRRLVRIEEMGKWFFYPDSETMQFSYEHGAAKRKTSAFIDGTGSTN